MPSPKQKHNLITRFFTLLSIISFLAAGLLFWWQRYLNPNRLAFSSPPASPVFQSQADVVVFKDYLPTRIQIPKLGISLPVVEAQISPSGAWPTTSAGVSYLLSSPRPGQPGNSVFYGHNWPRLLGSLKKIQVGDVISITTDDGHQIDFSVESITEVLPSDTSILASGDTSQLTLYTCAGLLDSKRLVVTARPVDSPLN